MCGVTRNDRLRNEFIRARVRNSTIVDKMKETRLRLFSHLMSRGDLEEVRVDMKINIKEMRGEKN